jgi:PAS domain S-box-containing protein
MVYTPLIWALFVAGVLQMSIARYANRHRAVPGARPFAAMMVLAAAWALLQAPYICAVSLPLKTALLQLQFMPIPLTPPVVLILALDYTGHAHWLTRRRLMMLFVVPVITQLLALTYPFQSLLRSNFRLDTTGLLPVLYSDKGPWYWLHIAYSYLLIVVACGLLVTQGRGRALRFRSTVAIILAVLIPAVADMLFNAGLSPVPGYDPAPLTFVFTGGLLLWALLRFRLFSVAPVARYVVMDSIEDLVIVLDTRGHIVDLNRAAQTACEVLPAQVIGVTPDALPPMWAELFQRCGGRPACKEEVTIGAGESIRVYDLTVSPVRDTRNRMLGRLFILHDITRRKRTEAALSESEERFRLMLEAAPVPLVVTSQSDGTYRYFNSLAGELVGIAPSDAIGRPATDQYADPTQRSRVLDQIRRAGVVRNMELQLRRTNGETFWALLSAVSTHIGGEPVLLVGVTDISERKQAEEALRLSEEHYRLLAETIKDVVWVLDTETMHFTYISPSVKQLRGYSPAEIIAVPVDAAFVAEARESLLTSIRGRADAFRTGAEPPNRFYTEEMELSRKDGSTVCVEAITRYHLDAATGHVVVRGVSRNISKRKEAEAALRERTLEIEARNQELQAALDAIRTLSGLVPICAWCGRKIRDEDGQWVRVEAYLQARTDLQFSHGLCPDCRRKTMAEIDALRPK